MRKMKDLSTGTEIEVEELIVLKNFWEYYVTPDDVGCGPDIKFGLVLGFEQELGDFSLEEISPYIISRTKDLKEVFPAPGWEWL